MEIYSKERNLAGLDEKRQKLKINRLKSNERSEMFQDFQKVGGKVVEVSEDPIKQKLSRLDTLVKQTKQKQQEETQKEQKKLQSNEELAHRLDAYLDSDETSRSSGQNKKKKKLEEKLGGMIQVRKSSNPLVKPFNAFLSRLVCSFSGIFYFFHLKFVQSFINLTLFDVKTALKNLNPILISLLDQDKSFSAQLRKELHSMELPDYFELIYRVNNILDEEVFSKLAKTMIARNKPVLESQKPFLHLYKSFYVLYPYRNAVKDAIETTMKIEMRLKNLREGVVSSNISYVKKNLDFVFFRYLPKFNQLVDYYYKKSLLHGKDMGFKTFIGFSKDDEIGYYTRQWQAEEQKAERLKRMEEAKKKEDQSSEESKDVLQTLKEDSYLSVAVKNGLEMIYWYLDFEKNFDKFQSERDPNHSIRIQDKFFLILSLLNFFDEEFSFLFVSQKVKYNVFFDNAGRRVDMKNQLKDDYFKLNEIYRKEREYLKVMGNVSQITHGFTLELDEQSPDAERLAFQREQILRMVRNESRKVVDNFVNNLSQIVQDLGDEQNILQSPESVMIFENKLTAHRLCNHRTFADSFLMAQQVAIAIQYLLTDGELGGIQMEDANPDYLKIPSLKPNQNEQKNSFALEGGENGLPQIDVDDIIPDL